jgi:hypothetical protein
VTGWRVATRVHGAVDCRAGGAVGEAAPRPDTGGAEHPRCGACLHGSAVREPACCRGQAVHDPPGPGGPAIPGWGDGHGGESVGEVVDACHRVCRAGGAVGEAAPRPDTGGAEHPRCGACLHGSAVREPACCRGQAVHDPPGPGGPAIPGWGDGHGGESVGEVVDACHRVCRAGGAVGEAAPRPYMVGRRIGGATDTGHGSVPRVMCRGQAVPDPPAREGRQIDARGCGGAVTSAAGAVGCERPGLKPRAQSASPLKGAVRRPGARVDRLGAGAVGISRLQPAWGLSPAVNGRAIEDTAARLIRAACRARRVGHAESPRHRRGGRGSASPLHALVARHRCNLCVRWWRIPPPSGRCQAVPDPPARQDREPRVRRWARCRVERQRGRCVPRLLPRYRRGRARQRLAPTRVGQHAAGGIGRPWGGA